MLHLRVDEITAPVTIRRKKKPQRVDQGGHREHRDGEGPAHRQHRDAQAADAHRREVAQERDRAAVLIGQAPAIMLRDRASVGKTEAVTASAATEAASAAQQVVRAHRHAALGLRVGLAWVLSGLHQKWRYRPI